MSLTPSGISKKPTNCRSFSTSMNSFSAGGNLLQSCSIQNQLGTVPGPKGKRCSLELWKKAASGFDVECGPPPSSLHKKRLSIFETLIQLKNREISATPASSDHHHYRRGTAHHHNATFLPHGKHPSTATLDPVPHYVGRVSSISVPVDDAETLESEGCWDALDDAAERVAESSFATAFLGVCSLLPVAMAFIGVKHLENCPAQPKIPVYLLVGGCFWLLKMLQLLWQQIRYRRMANVDDITGAVDPSKDKNNDDDDDDDEGGDVIIARSSRFSEILVSGFLLVWFVCGNVWVFGAWKPSFDQTLDNPRNWCSKTVFVFSVVQLVMSHVVCLIVMLVTAVVSVIACRKRLQEY